MSKRTFGDPRLKTVLTSPDDRESLVCELDLKGLGQLAEVFRQDGGLWVEFYTYPDAHWAISRDDLLLFLELAEEELRPRGEQR